MEGSSPLSMRGLVSRFFTFLLSGFCQGSSDSLTGRLTRGRAHLLGAGLFLFRELHSSVSQGWFVIMRGVPWSHQYPDGGGYLLGSPPFSSQKLPLAGEHVPDPSRQMVGSKQASAEARVRGPGFDSFRMWWKTTLGANAVDCGRLFETDK